MSIERRAIWHVGSVVVYRQANLSDAALLAGWNQQLIVDEGHRNPMSLPELERRMAGWLAVGGYAAVVFERDGEPAGYALYRHEPDHVYLRQFFVCRPYRRTGIGRNALSWLRQNAWAGTRLRLDVLIGNSGAIAFWRAAGFTDYCLTMELDAAPP